MNKYANAFIELLNDTFDSIAVDAIYFDVDKKTFLKRLEEWSNKFVNPWGSEIYFRNIPVGSDNYIYCQPFLPDTHTNHWAISAKFDFRKNSKGEIIKFYNNEEERIQKRIDDSNLKKEDFFLFGMALV